MWVREQSFRNKDGSTRTYLHLVESRRVNGKVRQTLIRTLGRLDVLQGSGALDKLIASFARHSQRQWVQAEEPGGIPCGSGPLRDGAEPPPRP